MSDNISGSGNFPCPVERQKKKKHYNHYNDFGFGEQKTLTSQNKSYRTKGIQIFLDRKR